MGFTEKNFARQSLTNSNSTLYTVPSGTIAVVKAIEMVNVSSSRQEVYVYLVPQGDSVGVGNALAYKLSIRPYSIGSWDGWQVLGVGDTIQGRGANITVHVSGAEIT